MATSETGQIEDTLTYAMGIDNVTVAVRSNRVDESLQSPAGIIIPTG